MLQRNSMTMIQNVQSRLISLAPTKSAIKNKIHQNDIIYTVGLYKVHINRGCTNKINSIANKMHHFQESSKLGFVKTVLS